MDYTKVRSIVAKEGGCEIQEEQFDGTLGAVRYVPSAARTMQTFNRPQLPNTNPAALFDYGNTPATPDIPAMTLLCASISRSYTNLCNNLNGVVYDYNQPGITPEQKQYALEIIKLAESQLAQWEAFAKKHNCPLTPCGAALKPSGPHSSLLGTVNGPGTTRDRDARRRDTL